MTVMIRAFLFLLFVSCAVELFSQENTGFSIVENKSQWPDKVLYAADVEHGKLFFERDGLTYHLYDISAISSAHDQVEMAATGHKPGDVRIRGHVFHVGFTGANPKAFAIPEHKQDEYFNFFLGNDTGKWAGGCRAFSRMKRTSLYPGIDMSFYSANEQLKYDFIVHPGSNPDWIKMKYDHADKVVVENGRLKIITGIGEVWEEMPRVWQLVNGQEVVVPCEFRLKNNEVSFFLPEGYDQSVDLIIDPVLIFSTYSGSFSDNFGYTATYDSQGYLYSGSSAFGQGYPTTAGAYQTVWGGGDGSFGLAGTDIALTKYDISGTFRVWSTFLGGLNDELPHSLICNENDELLVYGTTSSPNFPVTSGAYDNAFNGGTSFSPYGVGTDYVNGSDIIVTRFNSTATDLINSTFIGGSANDGVNTATTLKYNYADEFRGEIDIDSQGNVLIASSTFSSDFPVLNAVQSSIGGAQDACLIKLRADLSAIIWSTFLGGSNDDSGYSAAFDDADNVYICGGTKSLNFPVSADALSQVYYGGTADGWISKINSSGGLLEHSTYFGSMAYDQLYFVETDGDNQVHIYGQTRATGNTFIVNAGWSQPNSGMLVTKLTPELDVVIWSTVFGTGSGKPNLSPASFLVDVCGKIYLSGWGGAVNTSSNSGTDYTVGMITTPGAYQQSTDGSDFYLLVIEADASNLVYASFFGGAVSHEHVDGGTSRFDRKGVIYQSVCAGCGNHDDFPIKPPNAVSPTNNSNNCNNGVFKYDFELPLTIADFILSPVGCVNQPVIFTNTSTFAQTFEWDFGDNGTSDIANPTHLYQFPGEYDITLVVTHSGTCNFTDTIHRTITIGFPLNGTLADLTACPGEQLVIGPVNPDPTYTYEWSPSTNLSDIHDPNPTFVAGGSTDYTLIIHRGGCTDTYLQSVDVGNIALEPIADTTLCDDFPLYLSATPTPANASVTWSIDPGFINIINDNPGDPDILIDVTAPLTLYVMAEANGCSVVENVVVNLVSFQTEIEGDFTACVNDTVQLAVLDPNPSFAYSWDPENLVVSGQNSPTVDVVVTEETSFYVHSQVPGGCTATDSVVITVSNLTSGSLTATATPSIITEGQTSQLFVTPGGLEYSWLPNSTLSDAGTQNPVASPQQTTTYIVTAFDGECQANSSVTVRVVDFVCGPPSIYIPNAFTPNVDDRNEKLYVRGNNITKLYFVIYDRWGEKMFETENIANGWDGMFKGRNVDPDVYVYYLEVTCAGGATYFDKGNITVIR